MEPPLTTARYVGAGWASAGYEAVVQDRTGRCVASFTEPFGGAGLTTFTARIADLVSADPHSACAVDTSSGLLGDALLRHGCRLYRVVPGSLPGTRLGSTRPATLAQAARRGTDPLSASGGMAQGRAAELLRGIVAGKHVEHCLETRGALFKRMPTDRRAVALTFDDGPAAGITDRVLDILGEAGVLAAFFCVGTQVIAHPDLARRIAAQGHMLGSHSFSHAFLPDLSAAATTEQISQTQRIIAETTGVVPSYFRPPYGARSPSLLEALAELGLTAMLWDVDGQDWRSPGAGEVTERVLAKVRPGSVVLLHDGPTSGEGIVAALPSLIRALHGARYELARLDHMANSD